MSGKKDQKPKNSSGSGLTKSQYQEVLRYLRMVKETWWRIDPFVSDVVKHVGIGADIWEQYRPAVSMNSSLLEFLPLVPSGPEIGALSHFEDISVHLHQLEEAASVAGMLSEHYCALISSSELVRLGRSIEVQPQIRVELPLDLFEGDWDANLEEILSIVATTVDSAPVLIKGMLRDIDNAAWAAQISAATLQRSNLIDADQLVAPVDSAVIPYSALQRMPLLLTEAEDSPSKARNEAIDELTAEIQQLREEVRSLGKNQEDANRDVKIRIGNAVIEIPGSAKPARIRTEVCGTSIVVEYTAESITVEPSVRQIDGPGDVPVDATFLELESSRPEEPKKLLARSRWDRSNIESAVLSWWYDEDGNLGVMSIEKGSPKGRIAYGLKNGTLSKQGGLLAQLLAASNQGLSFREAAEALYPEDYVELKEDPLRAVTLCERFRSLMWSIRERFEEGRINPHLLPKTWKKSELQSRVFFPGCQIIALESREQAEDRWRCRELFEQFYDPGKYSAGS